MKKTITRIILFILTLVVIFLMIFLLKNQLIEIIKLVKADKRDEIETLINSKGVWGQISIVLIEAIQMIVVCIPAEFVELASAISYSPLVAFSLCLGGVALGAIIIFFLVRVLRFDSGVFNRQKKKINEISKQKKANVGTQFLMYLLFIMPVVPLGAICYYGSSSKISFRRYFITCVTGVIPQIATSVLMGKTFMYFTSIGAPAWAMIIAVLVLAAILFSIITLILSKVYFNGEVKKGPNPLTYSILSVVLKIIVERKVKLRIYNREIEELDDPYLLISNHQSPYDFYYVCKFARPGKITLVGNRYYFRYKSIRYLFNKIHTIPKTLFYPDLETVKRMIKTVKDKQSIALFPEGRLSTDGTSFEVVDKIGVLVKKLNIPLVIINISGAYSTKPKWSAKLRRGRVNVRCKKILMPDEIQSLECSEIDAIIEENLKVDEASIIHEKNYRYHTKSKAQGIDDILYYCPHCHTYYTIKGEGNIIECSNCHLKYELDENYRFNEISHYNCNINSIAEWNQIQRNVEEVNINEDFSISCDVDAVQINLEDKNKDIHGEGRCTMNSQSIVFDGTINNEKVNFSVSIAKMKALAFSGNKEFEFYHDSKLYYFYPKENKQQVARWSILVDLFYKKISKSNN